MGPEKPPYSLDALLAAYPSIRIASSDEEENQRILRFFDQSPMKGSSLSLRYERKPDFFALLRMQAPRSLVVVADKGGEIASVGTISVRAGYVDGRVVSVGYLGDLRIAFDRRLLVQWRKVY